MDVLVKKLDCPKRNEVIISELLYIKNIALYSPSEEQYNLETYK